MGKQWVRQEVKKDWLQETIESLYVWISKNRQAAATAAGGAAVVLGLSGLLIYRSYALQNAAWDRLTVAEDSAYSGKVDSALQQISQLAADYPASAAAGYGLLFKGDILFPKGQYKEAIEAYGKVLENGQPKAIQPMALGDTALAQEASGQCAQASQTAQKFLELYGDHFLAPQVHACLARCLQAAGQIDQARIAYQKITLQYPETSWAGWAKARLDAASAAAKP